MRYKYDYNINNVLIFCIPFGKIFQQNTVLDWYPDIQCIFLGQVLHLHLTQHLQMLAQIYLKSCEHFTADNWEQKHSLGISPDLFLNIHHCVLKLTYAFISSINEGEDIFKPNTSILAGPALTKA